MKANTINTILDRLILSNNDCWVWPGYVTAEGYGRIKLNDKYPLVHRAIFEDQCGSISEGKELHHMCCSRRCCNLTHIQVVTVKEHQKIHKGLRGYCGKGHRMTDNNTYWNPGGGRICRECRRQGSIRRLQDSEFVKIKNERERLRVRQSDNKSVYAYKGYTLTNVDLEIIRKLSLQGLSFRAIGRLFGVTHGYIADIVRFKSHHRNKGN